MKQLSEYNADRIRMTREGFLEKHRAPVLLHRWETLNNNAEDASMTSHISMIDVAPKPDILRAMDPLAALGFSGRSLNMVDVVAFPIVKRSGAVLHDRVSVGRNRNADIHLPFRKVSKFHAFFISLPNGSKYLLADAGSTNGTFVGGRRIATGQQVEIADKASIQFSHFLFVFFTPAGFYSLLSGE